MKERGARISLHMVMRINEAVVMMTRDTFVLCPPASLYIAIKPIYVINTKGTNSVSAKISWDSGNAGKKAIKSVPIILA